MNTCPINNKTTTVETTFRAISTLNASAQPVVLPAIGSARLTAEDTVPPVSPETQTPMSKTRAMLEPIAWPMKQQLLRLLWEKPLVQIAQGLGCTSSAVAKRAKVLHLPTPASGYWKKKISGIPIEIPSEVIELMKQLDAEAMKTVQVGPPAKGRRRPKFRKKPTPIAWPSKQDFLRKLWTKPATHIARELGCCHQSVFGKAKAWELPVPGNGYWQRRLAGMQPLIPPAVAAVLCKLELGDQ